MVKWIKLILVFVIILPACASTKYWSHPIKTSNDFQQDWANCTVYGNYQPGAWSPITGQLSVDWGRNACLRSLGWYEVKNPNKRQR